MSAATLLVILVVGLIAGCLKPGRTRPRGSQSLRPKRKTEALTDEGFLRRTDQLLVDGRLLSAKPDF